MLRYTHMLWACGYNVDSGYLLVVEAAMEIGPAFNRMASIRVANGVPSAHEYAAALTEWKNIRSLMN